MFRNLIASSAAKSPWLFHINAGSCNGCDIELVALLTPRYDVERLGFKLAGTPRHADIVVVTGPVTTQSKDRVLRTISQVPEPRVIVTLGSCPCSGSGAYRSGSTHSAHGALLFCAACEPGCYACARSRIHAGSPGSGN